MPRMSASEAGRKGGLIGGKSRSPAKLAACKRNGFQKAAPEAPAPQLAPIAAPAPPVFKPAAVPRPTIVAASQRSCKWAAHEKAKSSIGSSIRYLITCRKSRPNSRAVGRKCPST